jgi:hypothetical protein
VISGGSVGLAKFGPGTLILSAQETSSEMMASLHRPGGFVGGFPVVVAPERSRRREHHRHGQRPVWRGADGMA